MGRTSKDSGNAGLIWEAGTAPPLFETQQNPGHYHGLGPVVITHGPKTALFCSSVYPSEIILPVHDTIRDYRDEGVTIISGFQSPLEKECLAILLRGKQPIIVAVARSLDTMRIPPHLRPAFDTGRVLFVAPSFAASTRRVTRKTAALRNDLVASLAKTAYIPHAEPGSTTEAIARTLWGRGVQVKGIDCSVRFEEQ